MGRVESLDTVTVFLKRDLLDLIALVEFLMVPHQTRGKTLQTLSSVLDNQLI